MKSMYAAAGMALLLLFGVSKTQANDNGERIDRTDAQQRREQRVEPRQSRIVLERRADFESRRFNAEPVAEQSRHANHLSAEERRALRQQINEAGQDIYNRRR